jgi:hypothetical protein
MAGPSGPSLRTEAAAGIAPSGIVARPWLTSGDDHCAARAEQPAICQPALPRVPAPATTLLDRVAVVERLPIVPAARGLRKNLGQAQFPYALSAAFTGTGASHGDSVRPSSLKVGLLGRRVDSTTAPVFVRSQKLGPELRIKKTVWTGLPVSMSKVTCIGTCGHGGVSADECGHLPGRLRRPKQRSGQGDGRSWAD